jgi:hypothetical protein
MEESLKDRATKLENNLDFENAFTMLNFEEKVAINAYTDNQYKNINTLLRGTTFVREHQNVLITISNIIFNAVKKMLPKFLGVVYRGCNLSDEILKEHIDAFNKKVVIVYPCFTSTSKNIDRALDFKGNAFFTIYSKNGIDVSSISMYPNEEEILLNKGTNFNIISINASRDIIQVIMEEV